MISMSNQKNQQQYCTNGCGTVSTTDIRVLNGLSYCPMCYMSNGQKYEKHGKN